MYGAAYAQRREACLPVAQTTTKIRCLNVALNQKQRYTKVGFCEGTVV